LKETAAATAAAIHCKLLLLKQPIRVYDAYISECSYTAYDKLKTLRGRHVLVISQSKSYK
jgi:hypothetical protein